MSNIASACSYFVDEAGDPTLFGRKGKILVGTEGCSRYFMLGLLEISEPEALAIKLENLRASLLEDPYFKKIPSMKPEAQKTAIGFHAKDDIPEVRREVFKLLMEEKVRFFAVIKDKHKLVDYVNSRNQINASYRYNPNEIYDGLVSRLFRDRLHKEDSYSIYFAKRGASDRTDALKEALETARKRFSQKWSIESKAAIDVFATTPPNCCGLQAVDYFLWALQRFYERHEDRYLEYLWSSVSLVHDIDDTRKNAYGEYYTKRNPLTLSVLERH